MIETHNTIARRLVSWGAAVLAVATLLGIYAVVQMYQDSIGLRAEIATMKARGCPSRLQGKVLAGNVWQEVDLLRPRYSSLRCYYSKGVKS